MALVRQRVRAFPIVEYNPTALKRTAELYRTIAAVDEIAESLIVNLDLTGGGFYIPRSCG